MRRAARIIGQLTFSYLSLIFLYSRCPETSTKAKGQRNLPAIIIVVWYNDS